ncbi:hypothetical protein KIN20_033448 [Parelaphostrongylus tenuis]|uniref:Uncharacterized protein n=1 Tax=Parelaphostrongylus tenuis TaxID=148309 RepID=A0AAD5R8P1_PARTN|nr:hypothetical protein KIN20_033448 [Parelaphostrongylus tenuis]
MNSSAYGTLTVCQRRTPASRDDKSTGERFDVFGFFRGRLAVADGPQVISFVS